MKPVFFHKVSNQYFCEGADCSYCNNELQGLNSLINITHKKNNYLHNTVLFVCRSCHHKVKKDCLMATAISSEIFSVVIDKIIPEKVLPVLFRPNSDLGRNSNPGLGATVFSAALDNKGINSDCSSVIVNDYTKLALKESWGGARIGLPDDDKKLLEASK